ncbi:MAG: rhodanese-like domain-containing protein [Balneolaceae bacterium]|nr:rhodanese-like domain-containing protein [Balneolaceae bacterium]
MNVRDFKSKIYTELATITKALANPHRLEIIELILDVRHREEYESGHIASAMSIPQDELIEKLKELPKDKEIVAYCRGPLCAMAHDALELLNKHGFKAVRLETGFPEWEINGLPVE